MSKQYKQLERQWCNHWVQFILNHPDKDWKWIYISINPNITCEIIEYNPNKPWRWRVY